MGFYTSYYTFHHWEWAYAEYRAGLLSYLPLNQWRAAMHVHPNWIVVWNNTVGSGESSEFVKFIQENVINVTE